MTQLKTSVTPVILINIIVAFLGGGIIGSILLGLKLPALLVGVLSGFIPIVISGKVQSVISGFLAKQRGLEDYVPPVAFPLAIRLIIGLIISAAVAYYFIEFTPAKLTFLLFSLIGLLSGIAMMLVMLVGVLTKK